MSRQEEFHLGAISHHHMLAIAHAESFGRMLHGEAHSIIENRKSRENLSAIYNVADTYFNKREKIKATAKAHPMERLRANSAFLEKTWGKEN